MEQRGMAGGLDLCARLSRLCTKAAPPTSQDSSPTLQSTLYVGATRQTDQPSEKTADAIAADSAAPHRPTSNEVTLPDNILDRLADQSAALNALACEPIYQADANNPDSIRFFRARDLVELALDYLDRSQAVEVSSDKLPPGIIEVCRSIDQLVLELRDQADRQRRREAQAHATLDVMRRLIRGEKLDLDEVRAIAGSITNDLERDLYPVLQLSSTNDFEEQIAWHAVNTAQVVAYATSTELKSARIAR